MKRKSLLAILILALLLGACRVATAPEPMIFVSRANIALNPVKNSAVLIIKNLGKKDSVLNWTAVDAPNIVLSAHSGSLKYNEKSELVLRISGSAIRAAKYFVAEIVIKSNDVDKSVFIYYRPKLSNTGGLKHCGNPLKHDSAGSSKIDSKSYVGDELLISYVKSKNFVTAGGIASLNNKYGLLTLKENDKRPNLVKIPNNKDPLEYAKILAKDPKIEYAEPNYYLQLLSVPNDPLYEQQWNLKSFGLEQAWDIETGKNRVVVAIIDSSVDSKHEDLHDKTLPGCDFNNQDNDPSPGKSNGGKAEHGTHVAGIAAAIGNNGKGIAGVAYGKAVKILPIKVFDDAGISGTIDSLIDAILWASGYDLPGVGKNPNPADIINMSVGANGAAIKDKIKSINDATAKAAAKGVLMIAASGNSGSKQEILYPAAADNVIAVGSVDESLKLSDFSNYNAHGRSVDLVAPGGFSSRKLCSGTERIRSSFPNDKYGCLSGTSMAAPYVTGVAALLLSQNKNLTASELKNRLLGSTLFDKSMNKAEYGAGILCADRALGAKTLCGR